MEKIKLFTAFAVLFVYSNCFCALPDEDQPVVQKIIKVNSGGSLEVTINSGDISIFPWQTNEIRVSSYDVEKYELKNIRYSIEKNTVKIDFGTYDSKDLIIKVPVKFNLNLLTKQGDVAVKGDMDGSIVIKTYGGDIGVKNVTGDITLTTNGGDIRTGDIGGNVDLYSMGGDLRMGKVNGSIAKLNTNGGDIRIKKTSATVNAKTMGGDIITEGIGGGSQLITLGGSIQSGPAEGNIKLETMGGDISLSKANGAVAAKTMGGDITLKNIKGSVTAKTYSGHISVTLFPTSSSRSDITTNYGAIDLFLPENSSTTVYAKVKSFNRISDDDTTRIYSDFPPSDSEEESKYTRGTYVINGGKSSITLQSSGDGIRILKAVK